MIFNSRYISFPGLGRISINLFSEIKDLQKKYYTNNYTNDYYKYKCEYNYNYLNIDY